MATTITNGEKLEIANEAISANLVQNDELGLFSTNYNTSGLIKGDTLKVGVYGATTAAAFNRSSQNYGDAQVAGVTYKNLVLDQHAKSTFSLDDEQASRADILQLMRASADAVVKNILAYNYGLILAADVTTVAFSGAASTFDADATADCFKVAKQNGYDMNKLMMVLDDDFGTALLKDPALQDASASLSANTLREAEIGRLSKFSIAQSSIITANAELLGGFITDGSAIAVGVAPMAVQSNNTTFSEFVTDPISGLTLGYREYYDDASGTKFGTFEAVYGAIVARGLTAARIKTAV